jgi:hypothetical protein
VQNAELLAKCMPPAVAAQVLPALLVRAAEHGELVSLTRHEERVVKEALLWVFGAARCDSPVQAG